MLFYTWPFLLFMLVVLPGYYALRRTSLWVVWLLAASYFFYAWWNPYYVLLVVYSTALDYLLVALMDHCPPRGGAGATSKSRPGATSKSRPDATLRAAFVCFATLAAGLLAAAALGAPSWRPALAALGALVLFMAIGARLASRRAWLVISIVNNLALLLFFKYAGFVEENLNFALARLGVGYQFPAPGTLMPHGWTYVLPVGISFFTFQSMSYTIDFYLGKAPRERNFLRFATFVCFFPQLMAGPIERARQMLPQFHRPPPFRLRDLSDGLSMFLAGLFKKLALANYLAIFVDRVYNQNPANFDGATLALATVAFAWQIYFDFSGYTDMARGLAKMLGFNLVVNFNSPYLATGLGDFWSRWHISLSTWFRDYVYIPLGGNRRGTLATYRNLFLTFVISGIWHGAAWNFAIWGALHAVGIMATRALERSAFYRDRVPLFLKRTWVFAYVCFAWIFFRADTLADAGAIVGRIFASAWLSPQIPGLMIALVLIVWIGQWIHESRYRPMLRSAPLRVALTVGMLLYLGLCSSSGQPFIYFQF